MPNSIEVEVPDFGIVEFPESTKPEEITSVLNRHFGRTVTPTPPEAPSRPATPEEEAEAQEPWYKPPASFRESFFGPEPPSPYEGPAGFERALKEGKLPGTQPINLQQATIPKLPSAVQAAQIPLEAVGQVGGGMMEYFMTPQGAAEGALSLTPARPAILLKWAKDMIEGGVSSVEDIKDRLGSMIRDAVSRQYISKNSLGIPADADPDETRENIQGIANDIANAAAMGLGAGGAIHGAVKPILPRATAAARAAIESEGTSARSQQEAAAIHGDLQPSPGEGAGEVSAEEGGGGVQPQAQAGQVGGQKNVPLKRGSITKNADGTYTVTYGDQVITDKSADYMDAQVALDRAARPGATKLSAEEQKVIDEERKALDAPEVEIVSEVPDDPTVPWAGQVATINRASGKIIINGPAFSSWLSKVPEKRKALAVRSLLSEERIHLAVDDASAQSYWDTLTAAEKAINKRRYTGSWSGERSLTGEPLQLSDLDFAHEAIRARMQQLARLEPREIAEAAGKERWTLQTITALETGIRTVREALGTKASKTGLEILGRMQANLDIAKAVAGGQPFAIDKQREFELPQAKPGEERPGARELGAIPVTAVGLEEEMARHLAESTRPSFEDYTKEMQRKFGDVQPGQLREAWKEQVWEQLLKAPGEKLREMVRSMGLGKQIKLESASGELRELADPPPDLPAVQKQFAEIAGQFAHKGRTPAWTRVSNPRLKERYRVIASLGERLIRESQEGKKALRREISPEDVRFGDPASWNPISSHDLSDPASLGRALTENARVFGQKVSETKRLTVMQNRRTGKVEMVSTYLDPRRGAVLVDPDAPSRMHNRLDSVLQRYRPLYSVLLDEPVSNYRQSFDSVRAFEDDFGAEARQRAASSTHDPGYLAGEGEFVPSPSGGRMTKPGIYSQARGALEEEIPMTDAEAGAVLDHLYDEVSKVETPEDMRSAFDALVTSVEENRATPRYRLVMTAIAKAYRQLKEKNPDFTKEQTIDKVLNQFYENASTAENREAFVKKSLGQFGEKVAQADRPRNPGAIDKYRREAEKEVALAARAGAALWNRRSTKKDIAAGFDAAWNGPNLVADAAHKSILLKSKDPQVLAAAKAVVQSGFEPKRIGEFRLKVKDGMNTARMLISHGNLLERHRGHQALKAGERLMAELDYARTHWNDKELQDTSKKIKQELDDTHAYATSNGMNLSYYEKYLPGRYDAEFMSGNTIDFGEQRVLGRKYKGPKSFASYYDAFQQMYLPKNYSGADLVAHAVRRVYHDIAKNGWRDSWKTYTDPDSGQSVGVEPKFENGKFLSPDPNRELVYFNDGMSPLAIWKDYDKLARALTNRSAIADMPFGKQAIATTAFLKHIILFGDFFHLFKLGTQYGPAITGVKTHYKRGWGALSYREADLPEAVRQGELSQAEADWSVTPGDSGWTPRQVLDEAVKRGANIGRIQDALFRDVVKDLPIIGRYNKFLFDKLTRGLMANSIVVDFERQFAKSKRPPTDILRDVVKDTNVFFGSIGRQGWFKSETMRDVTQLAFLAPQWVEGLVMKEVGFVRELGQYARRGGKEPMGLIGRAVGRGLLTMVALTQIINLITRRKTTFQNEEEGHKLDAWIPDVTGKSAGFWLSPMSVFAEVTHDLVRLMETKPRVWDAIQQVGENKLGPWSRLALVLKNGRTPMGEYITSTPGILKEGAAQVVPTPISFGKLGQTFGNLIAPKLISPPTPGATQRQITASLGVKTEPAQDALRQVSSRAAKFMKEQGLDNQMIHIEATTEPSYNKLRSAIRTGDERGVRNVLEDLRKSRTDEQIMKAMKEWSQHPFTGSNKNERLFLNELNDRELGLYTQAMQQKQNEWNAFLDAYMRMP